jgi:hypothetical protein
VPKLCAVSSTELTPRQIQSPYLTTAEAALYLNFKKKDGSANVTAFYTFRHRRKVKAFRRGGSLLFKIRDLDAALDEERPARQLKSKRQAKQD